MHTVGTHYSGTRHVILPLRASRHKSMQRNTCAAGPATITRHSLVRGHGSAPTHPGYQFAPFAIEHVLILPDLQRQLHDSTHLERHRVSWDNPRIRTT